MKTLLLLPLLFLLCLTANADGFDDIEKLYRKKKYEKVLEELNALEKKHKKSPLFYHYRVRSCFRLLQTRPDTALFSQTVKDYLTLRRKDRDNKHLQLDASTYEEWHQYVKTECKSYFLAARYEKAKSLSKLIAEHWQDTTQIYNAFFRDALSRVDYRSPAEGMDFSRVDSLARNLEYTGQDYKVLAQQLVKPFPDEILKLRAVYMWIATHVDCDFSFTHSTSIANTLERKKGVCQDFAELFHAMCESAGIETKIIAGYAKGVSYEPGEVLKGVNNHAWNLVKLNGRYYFIEVTWAACIREYDFYFLAHPACLVFSHYSDDWQFLPKPISRKDFDQLPRVYPREFRADRADELNALIAEMLVEEAQLEVLRQKLAGSK